MISKKKKSIFIVEANNWIWLCTTARKKTLSHWRRLFRRRSRAHVSLFDIKRRRFLLLRQRSRFSRQLSAKRMSIEYVRLCHFSCYSMYLHFLGSILWISFINNWLENKYGQDEILAVSCARARVHHSKPFAFAKFFGVVTRETQKWNLFSVKIQCQRRSHQTANVPVHNKTRRLTSVLCLDLKSHAAALGSIDICIRASKF